MVRTGQSAPGTSLGNMFHSLSSPAFNSAGQTAFRGSLISRGPTILNDSGIWSEGSGTLSIVARKGSPAPGLPGIVFAPLLSDFNNPVLNDQGHVAFWAALSGSGVNLTNSNSIWSDVSGSLRLIARDGDPAPGTGPGIVFSTPNSFSTFSPVPTINARGQIAFVGHVSGPGVNELSDRGIWATDSFGTLRLVVRKGQSLEVAPNEFRTIQFLSFATGASTSENSQLGFNDRGQVVFHAAFTDGTSGVFVSDSVAIPEPLGIAHMLACSVIIGQRASCRRSSRKGMKLTKCDCPITQGLGSRGRPDERL